MSRSARDRSGAREVELRVQQEATRLADRLPALLIDAERVAATVSQGVHGRRRVGVGETFWQFRRYQSGDSATLIDWRQSAKSQAPFVRENEWEAAESAWLWCDRSASMRYRSSFASTEKRERAILLLIALATLLERGGERIALLDKPDPPAHGRLALRRLAYALLDEEREGSSVPPTRLLPRDGALVLVGDFLAPLPPLEGALNAYAARGIKGHLLQVLDPAEEDLPFAGRTRFEGVEDAAALTVGRAEDLRDGYTRALAGQRAQLGEIARRLGWTFATHRTDRPPHTALLALYTALVGGWGR